ncbi:hypothetical protein LTR66_009315 [Elasticomyces elasticus]|nr:hypothetical protein LTR66_009315 [Elasticomyces elasticus]
MPKAEVGSTKHLSNKLKSKGLQRLRWYCQVCEKQCRDENGFKCHTNSESHVRNIQSISGNSKRVINDYSNDFKKDFIRLLRTAHGEKQVYINHFYQEYISDKEHVHMNATKWPSLTEFAKYLGREGICRVEEGERGLQIAWIDDSPEALRRREDVRKKERMDRGDEEREAAYIKAQIKRAQQSLTDKPVTNEEESVVKLPEGVIFRMSLGSKPSVQPSTSLAARVQENEVTGTPIEEYSTEKDGTTNKTQTVTPPADEKTTATPKTGFSFDDKPATVNVFSSKNNAFKSKKPMKVQPVKKMSEAERIMKEELERKRARENSGFGGAKRQRFG